MTRGPFRTVLLTGRFAPGTSIQEAAVEVSRRLDAAEHRIEAARRNRLPKVFADLCEEFGPDEVIDLIRQEGAKGLEAVYA